MPFRVCHVCINVGLKLYFFLPPYSFSLSGTLRNAIHYIFYIRVLFFFLYKHQVPRLSSLDCCVVRAQVFFCSSTLFQRPIPFMSYYEQRICVVRIIYTYYIYDEYNDIAPLNSIKIYIHECVQ